MHLALPRPEFTAAIKICGLYFTLESNTCQLSVLTGMLRVNELNEPNPS